MKPLIVACFCSLLLGCFHQKQPVANLEFLSIENVSGDELLSFSSDVKFEILYDEKKGEKVVVRWLVCSLDDDTILSIEHDLRVYFRGDINLKKSGIRDGKQIFEYLSNGNFFISEDRGTSENVIPRGDLLLLLKNRDAISCRVMMTVYLRDPYYSSIMNIPVANIIDSAR